MKNSEKFHSAKVGEIDSLISSAKRLNTVIMNTCFSESGKYPSLGNTEADLRYQQTRLLDILKEIRGITFDIDALLSMSDKKLQVFYEAETDIITMEKELEKEEK